MRTARETADLPPFHQERDRVVSIEYICELPEDEQIALVVQTFMRIAVALERIAKSFTREL